MIPALIGLRAVIDQAIGVLGPLEPVVRAWEAAQEPAPAPEQDGPDALYEPPRPTIGLFDPLPDRAPAGARPTNGAASTRTNCERCGAAVEQPPRGARRRYCSDPCRASAKAERAARREAPPGPEPLPDRVERPFRTIIAADDARSDPAALAGPRLPWEIEPGAS
jgi:hypothetical protein